MKKKENMKIDIKKAIAFYNSKKKMEAEAMTLKTLAPKLGVANTTLYNYIEGHCKCPIDVIQGISRETGMPICEFVPIKID